MDQHLNQVEASKREHELKSRKPLPGVVCQLVCGLLLTLAGAAQTATPPTTQPRVSHPAVHSHRPIVREDGTAELCASCIKDNLTYLAGPALRGRGSGTEDEHRAAEFIAGKLKLYGLTPAAEDGQYIQTATVGSREVVGDTTVTIDSRANGGLLSIILTHGKEIVVAGLSRSPISAPLQKLDLNDEKVSPGTVTSGAALLIKLKPGTSMEDARAILAPYRSGKAALVIIASSPSAQVMFERLAKQPPEMPHQIGSEELKPRAALVLAKQATFEQLWALSDGATVTLQAQITPWKTTHTWNVLGRIEGTTAKDQIILLSAHLDHLGIVGGKTYYGADDDASGTVAVMELARMLAKGPKPKRTIMVALWGSEESGLIGASYFLQHPTFPLENIAANLEFEMIGRPDPKLKPDELWLSGWERTNLGPELAQHGAKLVADPRPSEKFFTRSDNYALAKRGIVAQTVSSFGLHKDYHQTTDTISRINFQHIDRAIASMIGPVTWLANTDFKPEWVEGKKP
jgi:Peptidase family M28